MAAVLWIAVGVWYLVAEAVVAEHSPRHSYSMDDISDLGGPPMRKPPRGEAVSALTNGSNYVVDTSRNGARPGARNRATPVPDGSCDRGDDPGAGRFMKQYAIDLALNAGQ